MAAGEQARNRSVKVVCLATWKHLVACLRRRHRSLQLLHASSRLRVLSSTLGLFAEATLGDRCDEDKRQEEQSSSSSSSLEEKRKDEGDEDGASLYEVREEEQGRQMRSETG